MEVKYLLCNPTGNITALVESVVPIEKQPEIASLIMAKEQTCEQVGFITYDDTADICLRMAGGEFCGNATMSTAAYFCKSQGIAEGEKRTVSVKVFGIKENVAVDISFEKGLYLGTIAMPKPIEIKDVKFTFEGHNYWYPVVFFKGIAHVIIEDDIPVYMPERCIRMWCDSIRSDGMGLMLINKSRTSMRPLVYVKNPESLIWESSCASGSSAVGAYFAKKEGRKVELNLKEPGGEIGVEAYPDGKILLSGYVEI